MTTLSNIAPRTLDDFSILATKELRKLSWASHMKIVVEKKDTPVWPYFFVLKQRQEAKSTSRYSKPPVWIDGNWSCVDRGVVNAFHDAIMDTYRQHSYSNLLHLNSEVWVKPDGQELIVYVPVVPK